MADFDDLLSDSRKASIAPAFDNPFQDVFDGVSGRPRSPDPWSTGGWGDPDPHANQHHPVSLTPPSAVVPHGFREFHQSDVLSAAEGQPLAPSVDVPHHQDPISPQEATSTSVPLGSDLPEPRSPVKRGPLGPLPPIAQLPDVSPDLPAAHGLDPPALERLPLNVESSPVHQLPPEHSIAPSSSPNQTHEPPTLSLPDQTPPQSGPRVIPAIPPSPLTPHVPTPSSSSEISAAETERSASESNNSLAATDSVNIKYERIVSPLETPALAKRSSLEHGYSNLALGGEAPGWGSSPNTSSNDLYHGALGEGFGAEGLQSSVSPSRSVETVKDDGDEHTEVRS